ncbi:MULTISPECIES: hypothetical protein [Flavobacterium]|uniref:PQ loop repeat-containing protein n=1 Tax=Flavobacterium defluvii TaxID=370979 RepID=A0A1M5FZL6_9FLAO|nr:hypothetical protein [Flavobacterium defluvii]SHF96909.1 hypothetical protein SAMN05443663_101665 [Flavobacterium defluvii]
MKYTFFYICGTFGELFWVLAYMLIIYRGLKDKSYGMPLVPLALNLGVEFVFSFCDRFNLLFSYTWFLLDLGIVYTYFKYGYPSFKKYYRLEKTQWYVISILALILGILINYYGHEFFAHLLPELHDNHISIFFSVLTCIFMSICRLAMFFQRENSEGQSFIIASVIMIGNFLCFFQIVATSTLYIWTNPLMRLILLIIVVTDTYCAILLYRQLTKEGINPWKRL